MQQEDKNKSIIKPKNPHTLKNEILFKSSGFSGIFIALEGIFDFNFWKLHFNKKTVKIILCDGKSNLSGLFDYYEELSQKNAKLIGILDADFDRLLNQIQSNWYLIYTDYADLESTWINSDAFNKIIDVYGDESKIEKFEKEKGVHIKEYIRQLSTYFGQLRFITEHQIQTKFSFDLNPFKYIHQTSFDINIEKLYQEFIKESKINQNEFNQKLEELNKISSIKTIESSWDFVQGHDCMKILSIGFKKIKNAESILGKENQQLINEKNLHSLFCLAFQRNNLEKTKMYQHLIEIENRYSISLFEK